MFVSAYLSRVKLSHLAPKRTRRRRPPSPLGLIQTLQRMLRCPLFRNANICNGSTIGDVNGSSSVQIRGMLSCGIVGVFIMGLLRKGIRLGWLSVRARLLPRMGLRERLTDDRNRCVLQAGGGHHSGVRGEAERSDGRVSDDRWYLHQSRRIERLNAGHRVMIHYCSDLSGSKVTARFPRTNRLNRRSHPSSLIEPSSWRGSRRIRLGQVASGCIDGWYESSSRSQGSTKHRHA